MNRVIVLTLGIVLLGAGLSFAEDSTQMAMAKAPVKAEGQLSAQTETKLVEVGNKICPVSGNIVGEMGPAIKHEYNGKVYNLCCGMCPSKFDKDPAKYSKIAEDEVAQ